MPTPRPLTPAAGQSVFDHWELLDGDPLAPGSALHAEVVAPIRRGKGLSPAIAPLERFLDSHRMGRGPCGAIPPAVLPAGGGAGFVARGGGG